MTMLDPDTIRHQAFMEAKQDEILRRLDVVAQEQAKTNGRLRTHDQQIEERKDEHNALVQQIDDRKGWQRLEKVEEITIDLGKKLVDLTTAIANNTRIQHDELTALTSRFIKEEELEQAENRGEERIKKRHLAYAMGTGVALTWVIDKMPKILEILEKVL